MPLPFIIGGLAAAAGAVGVGSGIRGGVKLKKASDTMKIAKYRHEKAVALFKKRNEEATALMDSVGNQELEILKSFEAFSDAIERIQGRPEFKECQMDGVEIPKYDPEELKRVSVGAGTLLGGIGGATAGAAGGFAAAGATTSAIMALGTASTGTAISSLTGIAATNATLAALGGGSIAAGGGGMALGAAVLSGATMGVGLLVGGVIFNATGAKLSDEAGEAYAQAKRAEKEVKKIVEYFDELEAAAKPFKDTLTSVEEQYRKRLKLLEEVVSTKTQWSEFEEAEKQLTENTVLLVGLLYKMCQTNLVLKGQSEDDLNTVNNEGIQTVKQDAAVLLDKIKDAA